MRIGIDARELCGRPTGVGRYLSQLLTAWGTLPEAAPHTYVLYTPTGEPRSGALARLADSPLDVTVRNVKGGSGTWWEQVRLTAAVWRERPDVFFAPAYTGPLLVPMPLVLTLHDLSFLAHPEWFPLRMRLRRRLVTTLSARRARCILTVSQFSRDEIVQWLGIAAERVRVLPHGLPEPRKGGIQAHPRSSSAAGPHDPLVLYVGSIFNRRHVPVLIQAVARVAAHHPDLRLEIVGDNRTFPFEDLQSIASEAGASGRTTLRDYVSDEVLTDLYERAGVFAFLSDYEGFGLTPLEALVRGVPILVGDTPVAREVYGDAARYVTTTDVAATASALEALLFDATSRAAALARAPGVLERYSWERTARHTLQALVESAR
ncbi:MAG TPA: glycosyltransferase family 1 protein [Vicinamibacterales bacterium]|jgi:glycosyltransferase involved in cell wall biosynthesis